ncbi:MAG: T9SS type A sorting domain-containing protein [Chitinophagaceae bacterium]|nr:T9SS type A sorting domain-containing protein [Chitinophagaceae bacterium]
MKKIYSLLVLVMSGLVALAQSPQYFTATLVNGAPTFQRPNIGTPPSGLSTYSPVYHVFSFTAPVSGLYTFEANSPSIDNFGILYQNSFNPLSPLSNALRSDDGSSGNPGDNYYIARNLTAGTTYVLVSTSFYTGEYGSYQVKIEGPFTTPLPVEMASFQANLNEQAQVDLHWTTQTEKNCSYYMIQRSLDGKNFTDLARLNTKAVNGNSDQPLEYVFTDQQPEAVNLYRVLQFDIDGHSSSSAVLRIENETAFGQVNVFPNPVQDNLNVQFYQSKSNRTECFVRDFSGRIVWSETGTSKVGMNQFSIPMSSLQTGLYVVEFRSNGTALYQGIINKQ